ncbi:hypothetical protein [Arthrobacter sp. C152]
MDLQATLDAPRAASGPEEGTKGAHAAKSLGLRADWAQLPGHTVEVWLLGEHVASGVVDQAAEDDSVLWIAAEGISTRRIFDKSSGYQVWV